MKANLYLRGAAFMPCPDCHKNWHPKNENSLLTLGNRSISSSEKIDERLLYLIETRLKNCPFEIMLWILSEDQIKLWKELRSPEMKEKEIQKAINEHKMPQIEEIKGRVPELAPLPIFL